MDYASVDRDGDGALEYAQNIYSTPGTHDGLYWAEDNKVARSAPWGPEFGKAIINDEDWHGYHFRILESSGPIGTGRLAYSYLIGDKMSRGFASDRLAGEIRRYRGDELHDQP